MNAKRTSDLSNKMTELIENGAAILARGGDLFLPSEVIGYATVKDKTLFWVPIFPDGPQSSHAIKFTRYDVQDNGITFYQGKDVWAFIGPFDEFIQSDKMEMNWANWNSETRDWFDDFVSIEREAIEA